jgi:hypothetical protein
MYALGDEVYLTQYALGDEIYMQVVGVKRLMKLTTRKLSHS